MKAPNHLAGGIVFTGTFTSLSGINIFESHITILVLIVASLLPDVDHPKSVMGRMVPPLSTWLNRHYGHRTLTHSALALILSTLALALVEKIIAGQNTLSLIYFYAFLSHLVLDMMTIQGVPLLYPFYKNPFVLPGNPAFRLRTGDVKSETVVFCIFAILGIWLRPLFDNGFWTNYNRLFGTLHHLKAEFDRNEQLLEVVYFAHQGSAKISGRGYCIGATETTATLVEAGQFRFLDESQMTINRVIPTLTDRRFYFKEHQFHHLSIDSLNRLLNQQFITQIELHSRTPFRMLSKFHDSEQRHFTAKMLHGIRVEEIRKTSMKDTFFYEPLTQIAQMQYQLNQLQQRNRELAVDWETHQTYLKSLELKLKRETDIVQKEQWYAQYTEALRQKAPRLQIDKVAQLKIEVRQLKRLERLKNLEKRWKILQRNQEYQDTPPLISGRVTLLYIQ